MRMSFTARAAAIIALTSVGTLHAHHSSSMFDISKAVWITGTVTDYRAAFPHATIVLEEERADGAVRRWTIEGPDPIHLGRMRVQPDVGDSIRVCGFSLRDGISIRSASADPYGVSPQFVHGHALVMPDGHWELFGSYGSLAECMRSSQRDSWLKFLGNANAWVLWCDQRRIARQKNLAVYPAEFADEINALMAEPCE